MARTVYLHVGVAKTGTTYLQRVLYGNRDRLRSAGLLYPGALPGDQFVASVDLRQLKTTKFDHLDKDGAWDRLADEVRRHDADVVISHETLARCSSKQVRRALASFGDADVRVVLTLRDLGRQLPAVWQETIKNKATTSYAEFLEDVFVNTDTGQHRFFWKPQDFGKVVDRWGKQVGLDKVTVVTVPPSGAPRDELWKRFARAIDLPDVAIELPEKEANSSLGPGEAELLRHVNASLPEDFPWPRYLRVIKKQFAEVRLASRTSPRMVVPAAWHQAVEERAKAMMDRLAATGVRVVGDLGDLTPTLPVADVAGPDDLSRDELMRVAAEVTRDLVLAPPKRPPGVVDSIQGRRLGGPRQWWARVRARVSRG